ncbi:hypothetical protein HID58_093019 [Brassica napus]|uniref:Uncharacterized protein n=1 Tax=Brassica napus TaxID=3708 RepID=A0ABQ7XCF3_BRANA|nr:hypothetical protein HID58_093019 [Brassica napus]
MQDSCSFVGNSKSSRKTHEEKHQTLAPGPLIQLLKHDNVVDPGCCVLGDYVIEPRNGGVYDDEDDYSSDDDMSNNGVLNLDSWQGQGHHIRFIDMDASDFASSSRSHASPSGLLLPRDQRGGNRDR